MQLEYAMQDDIRPKPRKPGRVVVTLDAHHVTRYVRIKAMSALRPTRNQPVVPRPLAIALMVSSRLGNMASLAA